MQAVTLFSNIGATNINGSGIGDGGAAGKAVSFTVGAGDDFNLDSIRLPLATATEIELGLVNLAIWSQETGPGASATAPIDSQLVGLSYTGDFAVEGGGDANATGVFEFSPDTALILEAETTYWLAFNAFDNIASNPFVNWQQLETGTSVTTNADISTASPNALFPQGGGGGPQARNPELWTGSSGIVNGFELNGTAIPEPSVFGLLSLGAFSMFLRRRK